MIGTIQKLTEDQKKAADELVKQLHDADRAYKVAIRYIRESCEKLWKALHDFYPDLAEYECTYDHNEGEIVVTGRKERSL